MGMRTQQGRVGEMLAAHYTNSVAGLNITDSPFAVSPSSATGGYNYEYVKTGGFAKSFAPIKINSSADGQFLARGYNLHSTKANVRTVIRMAGAQIQSQNITTGATTTLTADTSTAGSSFFSGTGLAYSFMFTNPSSDVLWTASPALTSIQGVYSTTKVTANGTPIPTGTITATRAAAGGGTWTTTGTYFWAVAFHKAGTAALSNAVLDVSATVSVVTDKVTIDLSAISNVDTTRYDKIYLYRSVVSGVTGFTAGDLVATLPSTTTTYDDTGSSLSSAQSVPRASSTVLDNSALPVGTYPCIAVWKQRLITASSSTVYLSDVNKPESWPTTNTINIPSGGSITAVAVVGYNHPGGSSTDEFLGVFKENELWLITGSSASDWKLQFVDFTGCIQQGLIASANGFMYWIDRRGVHIWNGSSKPTYVSRPIEYMFGDFGDIDKANLSLGTCDFFQPLNQVIWYLSSNTIGAQQLVLKLDLRLTLPLLKNFLGESVIEGVFLLGMTTAFISACKKLISPTVGENKEYFIAGDNVGNTYKMYTTTAGSGNDVNFSYITSHLEQDLPSIAKQYSKVIVWVDNISNGNLTLDYWSDYRVKESEKSSLTVSMNSGASSSLSIWDIGFWDVASWSDSIPTLTPIVFNLPPGASYNNNNGDAIRLRFTNTASGQPVTINSFSVLYTVIGLRK